jgi:single-strand DNA-binding protein
MANDLNQCNFIGRLGADPELRYTQAGTAVASFRMAVGRQWNDSTGQKQEATVWVSCVAWDKLGEIVGEYFKKGVQVAVTGRLQTREWQDQSGNKRYSTEIVLERAQMLGSRQDNEAREQRHPPQQQRQPPQRQQAPAYNPQEEGVDDDIPF